MGEFFIAVSLLNTLRLRQNYIFKCIFLNENVWILIKISLKFLPKCPINNIPSLVQIMAWHHPSRWQAIIWTNDGIVYWHIYALLGLNELRYGETIQKCKYVFHNSQTNSTQQKSYILIIFHRYSQRTMYVVPLISSIKTMFCRLVMARWGLSMECDLMGRKTKPASSQKNSGQELHMLWQPRWFKNIPVKILIRSVMFSKLGLPPQFF